MKLGACRCVGLCVETRPDFCGAAEVQRMLEFGATRVEMGVQTLDDDIYPAGKPGTPGGGCRQSHGPAQALWLQSALPLDTRTARFHAEHDLEMTRQLFDDPRFRPDGLKIYPTMVVAGTVLEQWYREGRYRPYDDNTLLDLVVGIKAVVPPYVRISRVLRDIPVKFIVAGYKDSLRGPVKKRMQEKGLECY